MKSNIVTMTNPQNRDHSAAPCFAIKESCVVPGRSRHHQEDLDVENISVLWSRQSQHLLLGVWRYGAGRKLEPNVKFQEKVRRGNSPWGNLPGNSQGLSKPDPAVNKVVNDS